MRIRAETRFKHGRLSEALAMLGWNQAELGRRTGIHPTRIGEIINMRQKPSKYYTDKIECALAVAGVMDTNIFGDWPDEFKCMHKVIQTKDVPDDMLLTMDGNSPKLVSEYSGENMDIEYMMEKISEMPERERFVIENVYLGDMNLIEFGKHIGRTRQRAEQIFKKAIENLTKEMNEEERND